MSSKARAIRFWLAAVLTSLLVQGCGFRVRQAGLQTAPPTYTAAAPSAVFAPPTAEETEAAPPTLVPTRQSPTSAPPRVTVTAVNGNIFIHRGPDLAFNSVSVLTKGQTAVATARDVLNRWLEIKVPGDPERTGWITIVTSYTSVTGDVQGLPEVEQTIWPELASLRNCTHHLMTTDPGGIDIPPVDYFPDNEVRINPGVYSILDLDVDKYPEVLSVTVREGSALDILTDGTGEKKKCPLP